jgi:hypothetical protein
MTLSDCGQGCLPALGGPSGVTIEDICGPLGQPLPAVLRAQVYVAWCTGQLISVVTWLESDQDD